MENELFWELFRDTGDPVAWLIHRSVREETPSPPEKEEEPGRQTSGTRD